MGSGFLRPFLQTLCCNSPWSYAVFWKLKHEDEMILAWDDGFCNIPKSRDAMVSPAEDLYFRNSNTILSPAPMPSPTDGTPGDYLIEFAVAEMSHSSHVVGKGVVGEAAFKGNARWIYSDNIQTDVLDSILAAKHPEEWLLQFAAGIKTILLLPVIPDGVLQLGSMEMVAEDAALASHVKNKFDTHKESDGCFQQFSLMSTFLDYLEEPSTFTTVIEDHNSINAVEDHHLITNQMVPVFMFQDFCNSSERHAADSLENMDEREFDQVPMGMIHAPEPCQSSFADFEDEISKLIHEERLRASPHCHEFHSMMCGSLANELMDYGFEEGARLSTFLGNGFDDDICNSESNLFNFSEAFELGKDLGSVVQEKTYEHISDESIVGEEIVEFPVEQVERGHGSNPASNSFDDNSSEKSNVTSINLSSRGVSRKRGQSKCNTSIQEDRVPSNFLISESSASRTDTRKKFSASVSSVESKISSLSDKQQMRKEHKLSRVSKTCKKREHGSDNHKPRPRDRQLIQDRIKELRDLVPNSEKCSIDGLLDKTIKHMLFLRNVSNQADKLRHPIPEEEVGENTTKPAEGTSWAVELGSEQNFCPIVVKDLDQPRHMLIEMVCSDHDRFLEIADVLHRLKLTILKGVMEKATDDSSRARFIVEMIGRNLQPQSPIFPIKNQNSSLHSNNYTCISYLPSLINIEVFFTDIRMLPSTGHILAVDATTKRWRAHLNRHLSPYRSLQNCWILLK